MGCGWTGRVFIRAMVSSVLPMVCAAQTVPWDQFVDTRSSSVCDLINAANAELVVLSGTGQLVLVTGEDVTLDGTFVDQDGFAFFDGTNAGLIAFQEDGDGFRTLWWTTLTGSVVNVDPFTGEPTDSGLFPSDFTDVPCDACDFWDDQTVCVILDEEETPPTPPPFTINLCGLNTQLSMSLTLLGLTSTRLARRRAW